MALIRKSEMWSMGSDELESKLADIENELRAEVAALKSTGKPENPGRLRELKRARARIKTVLNHKKRFSVEKQEEKTLK